MAKHRTRFVIRVGEHLRELISVVERTSGDLTVAVKRPLRSGSITEPDGGIAFADWRFTFHISPQSQNYTFIEHFRLSDGTYDKKYAYAPKGTGRMLRPVWAFSTCEHDKDHYIANIRGGDKVVSLGEYDPKYNKLVIFLLVTDVDYNLTAPPDMSVARAKFESFSVCLLYGFLFGPSLAEGNHGSLIDAATSDWRGVQTKFDRGARNGFVSKGHVIAYINQIVKFFAEEQRKRLYNFFRGTGGENYFRAGSRLPLMSKPINNLL